MEVVPVKHKLHQWKGVVESVIEQDIVYVRWKSGIGLIYPIEILVPTFIQLEFDFKYRGLV